MEDAVRPSEQAIKAMFERGFRTWYDVYDLAISDTSPPWDYLQQLDNGFPNHPYFPDDLAIDSSSSHAMYAKAVSAWGTTETACDLPSFDEDILLPVALQNQTIITISKKSPIAFPQWFSTDNNHITILVLAWTYILSARWSEVVPGALSPEYSNCEASWDPSNSEDSRTPTTSDSCSTSPCTIDIGDVDIHAARWWSAVLALDSGWSTPIQSDGGDVLHSPWHPKIVSEQPFMISRGPNPLPTQNHPPASFTAALGYLSNYCHLHNIVEQGRVALAAALLLPVVNYDNRMVQLPSPRVHRKRHPEKEKIPNFLLPGNDIRQFDRLLMMSCNPRGTKSLLNSIFFESDVDCNICGEWIQGTFAFVDSDLCASDQHLLARVLMKRDPKLGFLWLGAFVLGSYKGALQEARRCSWQLDFNAAAWTGTRISFIQEPVLEKPPDLEIKEITRADECRLMYLSHDSLYTNPPLFPWPPFGSTSISDIDLNVREHIRCPGLHGLRLKSITWKCLISKNPIALPNLALRSLNGRPTERQISIPFDDLNLDNDNSEMVTRNMFTWLREDAGYPVAEKAIREHEWIAGWESDDDSPITGDALSSVKVSLHGWIAKTVTKRSNSM